VADLAVTGPSLRVRIPRADDAAALFRQASDPEVTRWFSWGPYISEEEAHAYLVRLPGQRERGEQLDLVVEHLQAGPIGIIGLAELSARDRRASVGTWLGRDWWGTGANRECKASSARACCGAFTATTGARSTSRSSACCAGIG